MTMTLASSRSAMNDDGIHDNPPLEPDEGHWREIIGQIGTEVGLPLSAALERVTVLATTGKIDRAGLRMLREEIERARRAGMIGQQLARFASGRIRQTPEQMVADHDLVVSPGPDHLRARAHSGHLSERHQQHAVRFEADYLRKHRRLGAVVADLADLPDMRHRPGAFDFQRSTVDCL